jgi:hypothetical protein
MAVPVIYAELMQGPGAERTGGIVGQAGARRAGTRQCTRVVASRPLGATALPETLRAITPAALESKREALVWG